MNLYTLTIRSTQITAVTIRAASRKAARQAFVDGVTTESPAWVEHETISDTNDLVRIEDLGAEHADR